MNHLAAMSVDELWTLHEEIRSVLSAKIDAKMRELERRLVQLKSRLENKPNARRSPLPESSAKVSQSRKAA
jgi:DNA-binding protein H-NS